jgi:hypothetical protein
MYVVYGNTPSQAIYGSQKTVRGLKEGKVEVKEGIQGDICRLLII